MTGTPEPRETRRHFSASPRETEIGFCRELRIGETTFLGMSRLVEMEAGAVVAEERSAE